MEGADQAEDQKREPGEKGKREGVEKGEAHRGGCHRGRERQGQGAGLRILGPVSAPEGDGEPRAEKPQEREEPDKAGVDEHAEVLVVEDAVLGQEGQEAAAEHG